MIFSITQLFAPGDFENSFDYFNNRKFDCLWICFQRQSFTGQAIAHGVFCLALTMMDTFHDHFSDPLCLHFTTVLSDEWQSSAWMTIFQYTQYTHPQRNGIIITFSCYNLSDWNTTESLITRFFINVIIWANTKLYVLQMVKDMKLLGTAYSVFTTLGTVNLTL